MSQPNIKKAARWYIDHKWSVIPIVPGKKRPAISWQEYQQRLAVQDELDSWFNNGEGIGVVCGQVSGLVVLDADSEEGFQSIKERMDVSVKTPICKTPRGWHVYFHHPGGFVPNGVRVIDGVDIRGDGGQVVAPPTPGYKWIVGPHQTGISDLPIGLQELVLNNRYAEATLDAVLEDIARAPRGTRNDTLNQGSYKLGQLMVSAGWSRPDVEDLLRRAAAESGLNGHEVDSTMRSGLESGQKHPLVTSVSDISTVSIESDVVCRQQGKRPSADVSKRKQVSASRKQASAGFEPEISAEQIRAWIITGKSNFYVNELDREFNFMSRQDKNRRSTLLNRMVEAGEIERIERGLYKIVIREYEDIDYLAGEEKDFAAMCYPLDLHKLVDTPPGSLVVVAGTTNSGKTAFCLNIIKDNQDQWPGCTYYWTSSAEGNVRVLRKRLALFDIPLNQWSFKARRPGGDFEDVIDPDGLNVIDYLEVHDEFYLVGKKLAAIHERLREGVAVVALQKNPGAKFPRGGWLALDKAALAVAIDAGRPNKLTIQKAKYPKGGNPIDGRTIEFFLFQGHKFERSIMQKARDEGFDKVRPIRPDV